MSRVEEWLSWKLLNIALKWWARRYLDQWDKIQFPTNYGPVYVRIARETQWPDSYDHI